MVHQNLGRRGFACRSKIIRLLSKSSHSAAAEKSTFPTSWLSASDSNPLLLTNAFYQNVLKSSSTVLTPVEHTMLLKIALWVTVNISSSDFLLDKQHGELWPALTFRPVQVHIVELKGWQILLFFTIHQWFGCSAYSETMGEGSDTYSSNTFTWLPLSESMLHSTSLEAFL